ncbi:hypothetical protein CXG81DRAFT_30444 [Caulochytrium protostelioides]|uniref:Uncharacterized protein n=1 Tax=Caulochytrium protostelioides TaxID=1555241 RepID=A0A4P9X102_9FUNG|nr:hypothetical protein CXG81DRAFT_30444 [Caulochytrium protostelioides]|eukprot:RKO98483.1 hypothetical protein CXG81DRAFT_30444 [Caulochytrium protostelioides]
MAREGYGGGARFPYPRWVWTPFGNAWPNPRHGIMNNVVSYGIAGFVAYHVFQYSASIERRAQYPDRWIPSMLWAKEFHDPVLVAQWKERLALEGREWIEPIPSWWPFQPKASSSPSSPSSQA